MSLHSHLGRLRNINDQMHNLHARILNCADAFNGSRPQEAVLRDDRKSGHTLNSQFDEVISDLQSILSATISEVERLEEQIMEPTVSSTRAMAERVY